MGDDAVEGSVVSQRAKPFASFFDTELSFPHTWNLLDLKGYAEVRTKRF